MWFALRIMLRLLRVSGRARQDLVLENLVLRHQLAILERPGRRPALRATDRRFLSLVAHEWRGWRDHVHIVQPTTVVRWHRTAWRRYWRWRSRGRRPGRSRIGTEARAALTQIVQENPRWGVQRIVGELRALGFAVSATTVRRYRAGIQRPLLGAKTTSVQVRTPSTSARTASTLRFARAIAEATASLGGHVWCPFMSVRIPKAHPQ